MGSRGSSEELSREELAWEFVELFDELSVDHVNEMLAKNVPIETLRFVSAYSEDFADVHKLEGSTRRAVPNLMLFGYLVRVLEERLLGGDEPS